MKEELATLFMARAMDKVVQVMVDEVTCKVAALAVE
jgi:hypothetical protein